MIKVNNRPKNTVQSLNRKEDKKKQNKYLNHNYIPTLYGDVSDGNEGNIDRNLFPHSWPIYILYGQPYQMAMGFY